MRSMPSCPGAAGTGPGQAHKRLLRKHTGFWLSQARLERGSGQLSIRGGGACCRGVAGALPGSVANVDSVLPVVERLTTQCGVLLTQLRGLSTSAAAIVGTVHQLTRAPAPPRPALPVPPSIARADRAARNSRAPGCPAVDYRPLLQLQLPGGGAQQLSRQLLALLQSLTLQCLQLVEVQQSLTRQCQALLALAQRLTASLAGA